MGRVAVSKLFMLRISVMSAAVTISFRFSIKYGVPTMLNCLSRERAFA